MWGRYPTPENYSGNYRSNQDLWYLAQDNRQYQNGQKQPLCAPQFPHGPLHQWNGPGRMWQGFWSGNRGTSQGTWYPLAPSQREPASWYHSRWPRKQNSPKHPKQSRKPSCHPSTSGQPSDPPKMTKPDLPSHPNPSESMFLPPTSIPKQPDLPMSTSMCKQPSQPSTMMFLPPSSTLKQPDLSISTPSSTQPSTSSVTQPSMTQPSTSAQRHSTSFTQPSTSRPSTPTFIPPSSTFKQLDLPASTPATQPFTSQPSTSTLKHPATPSTTHPSTLDPPPQPTDNPLSPLPVEFKSPQPVPASLSKPAHFNSPKKPEISRLSHSPQKENKRGPSNAPQSSTAYEQQKSISGIVAASEQQDSASKQPHNLSGQKTASKQQVSPVLLQNTASSQQNDPSKQPQNSKSDKETALSQQNSTKQAQVSVLQQNTASQQNGTSELQNSTKQAQDSVLQQNTASSQQNIASEQIHSSKAQQNTSKEVQNPVSQQNIFLQQNGTSKLPHSSKAQQNTASSQQNSTKQAQDPVSQQNTASSQQNSTKQAQDPVSQQNTASSQENSASKLPHSSKAQQNTASSQQNSTKQAQDPVSQQTKASSQENSASKQAHSSNTQQTTPSSQQNSTKQAQDPVSQQNTALQLNGTSEQIHSSKAQQNTASSQQNSTKQAQDPVPQQNTASQQNSVLKLPQSPKSDQKTVSSQQNMPIQPYSSKAQHNAASTLQNNSKSDQKIASQQDIASKQPHSSKSEEKTALSQQNTPIQSHSPKAQHKAASSQQNTTSHPSSLVYELLQKSTASVAPQDRVAAPQTSSRPSRGDQGELNKGIKQQTADIYSNEHPSQPQTQPPFITTHTGSLTPAHRPSNAATQEDRLVSSPDLPANHTKANLLTNTKASSEVHSRKVQDANDDVLVVTSFINETPYKKCKPGLEESHGTHTPLECRGSKKARIDVGTKHKEDQSVNKDVSSGKEKIKEEKIDIEIQQSTDKQDVNPKSDAAVICEGSSEVQPRKRQLSWEKENQMQQSPKKGLKALTLKEQNLNPNRDTVVNSEHTSEDGQKEKIASVKFIYKSEGNPPTLQTKEKKVYDPLRMKKQAIRDNYAVSQGTTEAANGDKQTRDEGTSDSARKDNSAQQTAKEKVPNVLPVKKRVIKETNRDSQDTSGIRDVEKQARDEGTSDNPRKYNSAQQTEEVPNTLHIKKQIIKHSCRDSRDTGGATHSEKQARDEGTSDNPRKCSSIQQTAVEKVPNAPHIKKQMIKYACTDSQDTGGVTHSEKQARDKGAGHRVKKELLSRLKAKKNVANSIINKLVADSNLMHHEKGMLIQLTVNSLKNLCLETENYKEEEKEGIVLESDKNKDSHGRVGERKVNDRVTGKEEKSKEMKVNKEKRKESEKEKVEKKKREMNERGERNGHDKERERSNKNQIEKRRKNKFKEREEEREAKKRKREEIAAAEEQKNKTKTAEEKEIKNSYTEREKEEEVTKKKKEEEAINPKKNKSRDEKDTNKDREPDKTMKKKKGERGKNKQEEEKKNGGMTEEEEVWYKTAQELHYLINDNSPKRMEGFIEKLIADLDHPAFKTPIRTPTQAATGTTRDSGHPEKPQCVKTERDKIRCTGEKDCVCIICFPLLIKSYVAPLEVKHVGDEVDEWVDRGYVDVATISDITNTTTTTTAAAATVATGVTSSTTAGGGRKEGGDSSGESVLLIWEGRKGSRYGVKEEEENASSNSLSSRKKMRKEETRKSTSSNSSCKQQEFQIAVKEDVLSPTENEDTSKKQMKNAMKTKNTSRRDFHAGNKSMESFLTKSVNNKHSISSKAQNGTTKHTHPTKTKAMNRDVSHRRGSQILLREHETRDETGKLLETHPNMHMTTYIKREPSPTHPNEHTHSTHTEGTQTHYMEHTHPIKIKREDETRDETGKLLKTHPNMHMTTYIKREPSPTHPNEHTHNTHREGTQTHYMEHQAYNTLRTNREGAQIYLKEHHTKNSTVIRTPDDGRFLILQYPSQEYPSECPDCYTPTCHTYCSYNTVNEVITHVCPSCHLAIFFISDQRKDVIFRGFSENTEVEFTLASICIG